MNQANGSASSQLTQSPYDRIQVTENVHSANGTLIVEKGAVGDIRSRDQGYVYVDFDGEQQAYVKPAYGGRLFQEVPFNCTQSVVVANATQSGH